MSGSSSLSEVELPIDLIYSTSAQSGPGGDSLDFAKQSRKKVDNYSNADFVKLKAELTAMLQELEQFDLENMSKENLTTLKTEVGKHDLKCLFKLDLNKMKVDLQNKYHAELEILREDFENRIDLLNVEHDSKMQCLEKKYEDKMESLKFDLEEALRNNEISVSTAVQEVVSLIFIIESNTMYFDVCTKKISYLFYILYN